LFNDNLKKPSEFRFFMPLGNLFHVAGAERVPEQNDIGQNGADKMVQTNWYQLL